jgi:hypothetical protein
MGPYALAAMGHRRWPRPRPCRPLTVGRPEWRRPVVASEILTVGKEANGLERVEAGLVDEPEEVLTVYEQDGSEELRELLRALTVKEAMMVTGLSRRQVFYLRSGQRRSSREHGAGGGGREPTAAARSTIVRSSMSERSPLGLRRSASGLRSTGHD